ncbi:MAG: hypothetical protein RhofKO_29820 [Rhodothermales bacterium]
MTFFHRLGAQLKLYDTQLSVAVCFFGSSFSTKPRIRIMNVGAFSLSLSVKDLQRSIEFYEGLGFALMGGNPEHGWAMLKNGPHNLGLFQDMFEGNILTFNPGWDQDAQPIDPFTDVRELQQTLLDMGYSFEKTADASTTGPAHFVLKDPDGNTIMFDQHR